jgi:hypothetical protein
MNCNKSADGFKIFNFSQIQHNYSNEMKIKLTIENKNNFKIGISKSQMTLSIIVLTNSYNKITEIR